MKPGGFKGFGAAEVGGFVGFGGGFDAMSEWEDRECEGCGGGRVVFGGKDRARGGGGGEGRRARVG